MTMSTNAFRRTILDKLYRHLQDNYSIILAKEGVLDDQPSLHDIDAVLAFKSDPQLEELRSALDRLEDDTFGVCISCKGRISEDMLVANPVQRVCSMCEEQFSHVEGPDFHWPMTVSTAA